MSISESDNPHELFRSEEDHWNWDLYVQQCDSIKLTDAQRRKSRDSLRCLQENLGTGFLRQAFNQRHPIYEWYFANSAPPARLALIRFAESLRAFEAAPKFHAIIKRIKRRLRCIEDLHDITEAMAILEVAHRILQAGFDVELEPSIQTMTTSGERRVKKPDFKIIDKENGTSIVVEVSRMMASDNQRLTSITYETIFNLLVFWGMHSDPEGYKDILNPRHILPFAIIHRGIEKEELDDIVARVRALIEHVRSTGKFGELIVPNTIEVAVAPYDNHDLGTKWAREKGMREGDLVQGANISSDEVARTKVKIRDKLKQLPANMPGMIVIEAKQNLLLFVYDIQWLAATLAEEVAKYPNLVKTVIFHSFVDESTESASANIGPHTFSHLIRNDRSMEQSLTIRNGQSGFKLPRETSSKLDAIFIAMRGNH